MLYEVITIVIAEVLLQRTKAETVEKFHALFLETFPSWEAIAKADNSFIEQQLQPVGLYRQRAKRLKDLALEMVGREGRFPSDRKSLEQIPFLGQYIVNAIELQLFNKPRPLIDVNMTRVLERYFEERQLADIRCDPYLQSLAFRVINHPRSKEINWAILDFAASICKARVPLCTSCLLADTCTFYKKTYFRPVYTIILYLTMMPSFSYIDLFAGCGGLSLGLHNAGWKGLFAIEKSPDAFKTLEYNLIENKNHFDWPSWLPKNELEIDKVLKEYKDELINLRDRVDMVAGGPPCQGFSMAGRRKEDDVRNGLIRSYLKFIMYTRPKIIFLKM